MKIITEPLASADLHVGVIPYGVVFTGELRGHQGTWWKVHTNLLIELNSDKVWMYSQVESMLNIKLYPDATLHLGKAS